MRTLLLPLSLAVWLAARSLVLGVSEPLPTGGERYVSFVRPLLEHYCLDCHDGPKPKGDLDLGRFESAESIWKDPKVWERVLVQAHDRVMPPARKKQPAEEERLALMTWVRESLAHPDETRLPRDPGPAGPRRLSRLEYNCTVRDLLGVTSAPADSFPPDGGGGAGFDNNASTLFLPPLLLEKYLAAAETVLGEARRAWLFPVEVSPEKDEATAARENLTSLATRAFRRPPGDEALGRLLTVYTRARERGEGYESAVRLAAKAILISPRFLFRLEPEAAPATENARIDAYSLASRLSYFLWASMPDAELLRLAGEGRLLEPAELEAQTRRMLADPKAATFSEAFVTQWLRTKELREGVAPAPDKFPQFTPEIREAFYQEPVLFFGGLLRENRPLTDCLEADYTYANEALARFYDLPPGTVSGPEMQRIALPDRRRGGVLGMGGVLALTSYPRRTSPVLRGKWVMEEILGTPPPPPPPDVNTAEVEHRKDARTLRQRLEQHRAEPKCAGCHARMDPLGFGLENYDVVGRWRTEADKDPVDASGQLVDGTKFNGPLELKALLLAQQDAFTRNLAEKMLAYALGRGLEAADWWPVQQIARKLAADGYRSQTLILEVVRSYPFQYQRAPRPPGAIAHQP